MRLKDIITSVKTGDTELKEYKVEVQAARRGKPPVASCYVPSVQGQVSTATTRVNEAHTLRFTSAVRLRSSDFGSRTSLQLNLTVCECTSTGSTSVAATWHRVRPGEIEAFGFLPCQFGRLPSQNWY